MITSVKSLDTAQKIYTARIRETSYSSTPVSKKRKKKSRAFFGCVVTQGKRHSLCVPDIHM
jgi:hypothetical protein